MNEQPDTGFEGSIPHLYESLLVPMIFQPYAEDMANRVAAQQPLFVLEVAAGTGVLTRCMRRLLGPEIRILATDLNQAMLDEAKQQRIQHPVQWQQADVESLPMPDGSVDVVVCQFGVMFFPDKARAFAEMRRVLKPGGVLLFSVWGDLQHNLFAWSVTRILARMFPEDPPLFLQRTPHGHHDLDELKSALYASGFHSAVQCESLELGCAVDSAQQVAQAYCLGTPLRYEIERCAPGRLAAVQADVADELIGEYGTGTLSAPMQAWVVCVERGN